MGYICKHLLIFILCTKLVYSLRDEGKWDFNYTKQSDGLIFRKSLYKNSQILIKFDCEDPSQDANITVTYVIVRTKCWNNDTAATEAKSLVASNVESTALPLRKTELFKCMYDQMVSQKKIIYNTTQDGLYILILYFNYKSPNISLPVHVEMKGDYGYLSAADWPLLPFYGFMCIFYIILGLIWLVLSFMQWRDLLRVQFWIGGVILLGMLEKATFYEEFQSINKYGVRIQGVMLFAEWMSCAKRTLARMLVIIVSLGFGIVKPRLGAALHRVVGVGLLYFFLAMSESYLRITTPINSDSKDLFVASVPLAVLDSAICWWIFSALVNTTRKLRLRGNEVKLTLYRHFTNTLIFSVVASVIFMLYSRITHQMTTCLTQWKDLWLDEAYWHILFSALLLVIMILWRPTINNQRYASVALLQPGDDDDEDDEKEHLVNDAYGVKVRLHNPRPSTSRGNSVDDDIKWLEETIRTDSTLRMIDSDEELANTRFEVSKMQ